MPEQEGENQADAETHEPGYEEEGRAFQVLKLFYDSHPFRNFTGCLGEYFTLKPKDIQ